MTRAEAQAAYEARCHRRERRQPSRSVRDSKRQQRQEADRTAAARSFILVPIDFLCAISFPVGCR